MKTITGNYKDVCSKAEREIEELLKRKRNAVLALSTGEEQDGVYEAVREACADGRLSLKDAQVFLVNEYLGLSDDNPVSCRYKLRKALLGSTDIEEKNIHIPDPENPEQFQKDIGDAGGIDLAFLGIGHNCRIGFNEPATPFESYCHVQKLTDATKREKASLFGSEDKVPDRGFTMGIKTIVEARKIILNAAGQDKAAAVHQMLYGKTLSYIPASFLQIPLEVNIYLDEEAASML